jgi:hypothetical protein
MYGDWTANSIAVAATIATVALSVLLHYEGLLWLAGRYAGAAGRIGRRVVLKVIFGLMLLHVAEIWLFGAACWGLLALDNGSSIAGAHTVGLLDSVYLSAITFTTVGFGDLSPVGPIRFLSGTEALTGLMLITWSASFTYLEMARHWRER